MRVTFDSNAWQPVVRPDKFPKDPRNADFVKIQQAVRSGAVTGYIVETAVTLEAIQKSDRARYFAGRKPTMEIKETAAHGRVRAEVTIGPDHAQHPGIAAVLEDRLNDAFAMGFLLLKVPRIGTSLPPIALNPVHYVQQTPSEAEARQSRTFAALRDIEARSVGKSQIDQIGARIASRLGLTGPWYQHLDKGTPQEINEIVKAVAEWADADSIAAHIGYACDCFCTEDQGKSAATSILNGANRAWVTSAYGVQFVNLAELAARI